MSAEPRAGETTESPDILGLIGPPPSDLGGAYLHLLKLSLTGLSSPQLFGAVFGTEDILFPVPVPPDELIRRVRGGRRPLDAYTMIGWRRLDNVHACVADVIARDVPGDLIEAGVWKGGATILMRAVLKAHEVTDRVVFAADSFGILPASGRSDLRVGLLGESANQVKQSFRRFGVLDDQVRFVEGWFEDTLPTLRDRTWAVIRIDGGKRHESTLVSLENLYPGLSPGGYVIIDDYGAFEGCRRLVDDYRDRNGITEEIQRIDGTGVYWQKQD